MDLAGREGEDGLEGPTGVFGFGGVRGGGGVVVEGDGGEGGEGEAAEFALDFEDSCCWVSLVVGGGGWGRFWDGGEEGAGQAEGHACSVARGPRSARDGRFEMWRWWSFVLFYFVLFCFVLFCFVLGVVCKIEAGSLQWVMEPSPELFNDDNLGTGRLPVLQPRCVSVSGRFRVFMAGYRNRNMCKKLILESCVNKLLT